MEVLDRRKHNKLNPKRKSVIARLLFNLRCYLFPLKLICDLYYTWTSCRADEQTASRNQVQEMKLAEAEAESEKNCLRIRA